MRMKLPAGICHLRQEGVEFFDSIREDCLIFHRLWHLALPSFEAR